MGFVGTRPILRDLPGKPVMRNFSRLIILLVVILTLAESQCHSATENWQNERSTLKLVREINVGSGPISAYHIDLQSSLIFAGTLDGRIRIVSPAGAVLNEHQVTSGSIEQLLYSHNEQTLVILGLPPPIQLWHITKQEKIGTLVGPFGHYETMALSPDGRVVAALAARAGGGQILIWDVAGQKLQRTIDDVKLAGRLVFTPDGKKIVGAGNGMIVDDVATGALLANKVVTAKGIGLHALSNDGRWLAVKTVVKVTENGESEVWIYEIASWRRVAVLKNVASSINSLSFSPNNSWLAAGSGYIGGYGGHYGRLYLWRTSNWVRQFDDVTHFEAILSVRFSSDSKTLISADSNGLVKYWQIK